VNQEEYVAEQLLAGDTGSYTAEASWCLEANNPHTRDLDILPLGVYEEIDQRL